MKDLALMLGAVMPEDYLLDELKKALDNHLLCATEETRNKLGLHCVLLMSKFAADKDPEGAVGLLKKSDEMERLHGLHDLKKQ